MKMMNKKSKFLQGSGDQSSSEEDYERFDLDEEFEEGQFGEDGEFYYKEKKQKPKQNRGPTKDQ